MKNNLIIVEAESTYDELLKKIQPIINFLKISKPELGNELELRQAIQDCKVILEAIEKTYSTFDPSL